MATANELIMIFIGLEISSIASYVLAGYLRDDKRANEAALKYFLLGSFATAFFLGAAAAGFLARAGLFAPLRAGAAVAREVAAAARGLLSGVCADRCTSVNRS